MRRLYTGLDCRCPSQQNPEPSCAAPAHQCTSQRRQQMATWKRLTGAVDSSAQSFLKNKKFSREKRKFSWDWHAWNLLLVSTPSLVLGVYLHRAENRMHEEARVRDEIQERTGVSSRGFLIPQKKVRKEVQGMLSAGNQRQLMVDDEDGTSAVAATGATPSGGQGAVDGTEGGIRRHLSRQVARGGSSSGTASPDLAGLEQRLDAIERALEIKNGTSSAGAGVDGGPGGNKDSMLTRESSSDRGKGAAEPGSSTATAARKRDAPRTDAESGTAVEKAIGMASVAGSWAIEAGERHRKRLLQVGRDWLAGETRQDDARLEDATLVKGGSEQHAREVVADAVAENEGQPDLSKERDSSSSGGSGGSGRDSSAPGAGGAGGSDREGHVEEAWRRGSLDEPDKRR